MAYRIRSMIVSSVEKVRWVLRHEGALSLLRKLAKRLLNPFPVEREVRYQWAKFAPSEEDLKRMRESAARFSYQPKISVIVPVYNPEPSYLREAIESVLHQAYENWELCIADDASTDLEVRALLEKYDGCDDRIKIVFRKENGHISEASNSALEIATGEFVALLDHDDTLAGHALFSMVGQLNKDSELDMIYSNEDKISAQGEYVEPTFKGAWSPEYFLSFMYVGHLTLYRRSVVESVGGFRKGFEGSQDYDLALRVTERTKRIAHLPQILYHWRKHPDSVASNIHSKPYAFRSARRALEEALLRRGMSDGAVEDTKYPGIYRVRGSLGRPERVVVMIYCSSRQSAEKRAAWIEETGVAARTKFLLGVPSNEARLSSQEERIRFLPFEPGSGEHSFGCHDPGRVNFWKRGLEIVEAEYLVLLDENAWPSDRGWINALLEYGVREGVGVVGSHVVTPAGDHLHGGYVVFGPQVFHNFYGYHRDDEGYRARLITATNVTAVSSMGMLVRPSLLRESGALDLEYQHLSTFELHLCLSLQSSGLRTVWTPGSRLEYRSDVPPRVVDLSGYPADLSLLNRYHGVSSFVDPFYPPGLDQVRVNYQLVA